MGKMIEVELVEGMLKDLDGKIDKLDKELYYLSLAKNELEERLEKLLKGAKQ